MIGKSADDVFLEKRRDSGKIAGSLDNENKAKEKEQESNNHVKYKKYITWQERLVYTTVLVTGIKTIERQRRIYSEYFYCQETREQNSKTSVEQCKKDKQTNKKKPH